MNARIVAVGSELLTPFRLDTNSLLITERLNDVGIDVTGKSVVADDVAALRRVVEESVGSIDVLIVTGGLGPTADDVTRDAVALALDRPLEMDDRIVERIAARFALRGRAMPPINRRQALVPRGAVVIPNEHGTAPGLWLEERGTRIALLPGPPAEMTPMLEALIAEHLQPRTGGASLFRRVIKVVGMAESEVDTRTEPVYTPLRRSPVPIDTTILATLGQIELHLTAKTATKVDAETALDAAVGALAAVLGSAVVSTDGRSLEAVVGALLEDAGWTIAVAESCTGGLVTTRLTDVPGSSAYVDRCAVCYSNRAKIDWLGVPPALIAAHGAVSEQVASAMADGVRRQAAASIGVSVTGIAGPGGGTESKPVGTVVIAVAADAGVRVQRFRFFGERAQIKDQAARTALDMVRLFMRDR